MSRRDHRCALLLATLLAANLWYSTGQASAAARAPEMPTSGPDKMPPMPGKTPPMPGKMLPVPCKSLPEPGKSMTEPGNTQQDPDEPASPKPLPEIPGFLIDDRP